MIYDVVSDKSISPMNAEEQVYCEIGKRAKCFTVSFAIPREIYEKPNRIDSYCSLAESDSLNVLIRDLLKNDIVIKSCNGNKYSYSLIVIPTKGELLPYLQRQEQLEKEVEKVNQKMKLARELLKSARGICVRHPNPGPSISYLLHKIDAFLFES